jgi:N,N'-diacetyllegionaminate synthase
VARVSGPVLFLIPARGGSQRVPGKNLRLIGGIPLVGWAARIGLAAARALPDGPHRVVCSTDDAEIAAAARAWGAEVLDRPAPLATADATSIDVALHALEMVRGTSPFATLVLLQPTSPLTDPADVVAAVERHRANWGRSVVSVSASHPGTWHLPFDAEGTVGETSPGATEDAQLTGAFYVASPDDLLRSHRFVEPGRTLTQAVPSERSVDVDTAADLVVAEALLAARPIREVPLGDHRIGHGSVLVIAEAGVNHDGDVDVAHRLLDAAADLGADVVKFQTFDPEALAAAGAPKAAYQEAFGESAADQREMLRRLTLPTEAWAALQAHARDRRIGFLSTPFDDGSADLLDGLDVPAFKIGSGELTNLPFIARLARRGRPLLLSTGMASMTEVAAAVDTVAAAGNPPLALFHCVSSYPASPSDANLRAIETMRRAFGVPVGWSDHTLGDETALAAVAIGASMIEKHLTLGRGRSGPDHRASLEPVEFAEMVDRIRSVEAALGTGIKAPTAAESDVAAVARRSLHWRRALDAGTVIGEDDLAALRPGSGLSPARWSDVVGRRTAGPVRNGELVRTTDVEGLP